MYDGYWRTWGMHDGWGFWGMHLLGWLLWVALIAGLVYALVADGKQYLPLGWDGAPPGGHHRKGTLRFKSIRPWPKEMELRIRLAADHAPRSFKWQSK